MEKYKFLDKTPLELTDEELLELTNQITRIEYNRKPYMSRIQTAEDAAQEILCYAYEKSKKGKIGINEMKQKSMKHFINLIHLEARNGINYITRKKQTQRFLYNTLSLNQSKELNNNDSCKPIIETIPDDDYINKLEYNLNIQNILEKIDNTKDESIIIDYGVGKNSIFEFSFRNLTKLYLYLFNGKKITIKNLEGFLINKNTNTKLNHNEIKVIVNSYKNYLKKEKIFGGNLL